MSEFIDPLKIQEIKVATDVVCIGKKDGTDYILLIKRQYEPFKDHWALPGGFLRDDEELVGGAIRELKEETNLSEEIKNIREIGVFGGVGRDPRRRIISIAYLIVLDHLTAVSKANETLEVEWLQLDKIQEINLAFDHIQIINKALALRS